MIGPTIRTYVLDPEPKVKDLRTGVETDDAKAVLDGDLDAFIEEALVYKATTPPLPWNVAKLD